jgi:hypothetical protein
MNIVYVVEYSSEEWGMHHEWQDEEFTSQVDADNFALKMLGVGNAVRMYIKE